MSDFPKSASDLQKETALTLFTMTKGYMQKFMGKKMNRSLILASGLLNYKAGGIHTILLEARYLANYTEQSP